MTFGVTAGVFMLGFHTVSFCQALHVHVINISH